RQFMLQPTRLSRRLFARHRAPERAGLWEQLDVPEKREMDERCRRALMKGESGYEQQFHIQMPDGRTVWLRESVTRKALGGGEFRVVGLAMDITAQREAEQARRDSEERLRQLLARADCMLWQAHVTRSGDGRF